MRRSFLVVLAIIVVVGLVSAANLSRDPMSVTVDWQVIKTPPREVTIDAPARGPIVQTVTAPGVVEPVDEARIASQIVGRVVEVRVKDGDSVKKGDLLVKIDETEARARLDSSSARIERLRAAIAQADSDRGKADRDVNRSIKLSARNVATATELADARSALTRSEAALLISRNELRESEAMRRMSQQDLDRTEIRAPIDGVVAGCEVEVGEVVIAGTTNLPGTVLMTVGDLTRMQVRAEVDETDVPLVKPGQPSRVYLQADPSKPIQGKVDRVAPKGKKTEEVVSFETLVLVGKADQTLRSEMTATVEIEVRRADDVLGVPLQSVVHRRRKDLPDSPAVRAWSSRNSRSFGEKAKDVEGRYVKIVFVLEDGVARARPVETGISDEKRVEILSGLTPTDRVIVGPFRALDELKDGNPVTPAKVGPDGEGRTL
ncbi:MAG: family efflux transporter, subunit [Planctomycetota bacterium]|nr:family efflux transporter, subunit [Planctomycetota bacterium]